jgi:hypothetical protein
VKSLSNSNLYGVKKQYQLASSVTWSVQGCNNSQTSLFGWLFRVHPKPLFQRTTCSRYLCWISGIIKLHYMTRARFSSFKLCPQPSWFT